jgi:phosphatidylglycerol lysyltransferase
MKTSPRFVLFVCALCALLAPSRGRCDAPRWGDALQTIPLTRGTFPVIRYEATAPIRALLVFGSGDGGWSPVEEKICRFLARQGVRIGGVDFAAYASSDYAPSQLGRDLGLIVDSLAPAGGALPALYGGWSMGAEQSVPASASAPRPIAGLLLLAPGERGRFGLRASDRLGLTPTGEGTFALADYGARLGSIRVAQFHAALDPLDSDRWLRVLSAPHKKFVLPAALHDFGGVNERFQGQLREGVDWILAGSGPAGEAGSGPRSVR